MLHCGILPSLGPYLPPLWMRDSSMTSAESADVNPCSPAHAMAGRTQRRSKKTSWVCRITGSARICPARVSAICGGFGNTFCFAST